MGNGGTIWPADGRTGLSVATVPQMKHSGFDGGERAEFVLVRRVSVQRREDLKMRKTFLTISLAAMTMLSGYSTRVARAQQAQSGAPPAAGAPQGSIDQDIAMLRQDLRSQKKQIIALNMQLTTDEATKFWPIYDQYTAEMTKINDAKYAAIKEYADNFNTLTDDRAISL